MKGMVFYAYHGVYEFEKRAGQRFVVDAELRVDLRPACANGKLTDTVDYAAVYKDIASVFVGCREDLLERVADRVVQTVLGKYPRVQAVRLSVAKPDVAVEGQLSSLGIEISRTRTDYPQLDAQAQAQETQQGEPALTKADSC